MADSKSSYKDSFKYLVSWTAMSWIKDFFYSWVLDFHISFLYMLQMFIDFLEVQR